MRSLVKRNDNLFNTLTNSFFDDNLFNDIFSLSPTFFPRTANVGRVNIVENDDNYTFQVIVPGFKKDDINVTLENDVLTISSEMEDTKEDVTDNMIHKEYYKTSFKRSFYVPDDVDKNKIDAKMENGILNITFDKIKKEEKKDNKISIEVK
jgi:HSP20 family protein